MKTVVFWYCDFGLYKNAFGCVVPPVPEPPLHSPDTPMPLLPMIRLRSLEGAENEKKGLLTFFQHNLMDPKF